jgi:hypothetical protein
MHPEEQQLVLGFTGTQRGMTLAQKIAVSQFLGTLDPQPTEAHLGDCIGADAEFYMILTRLFPECKVVGHIPDSDAKRAFLKYTEEKAPLPYLVRNRNIVSASQRLLATPAGPETLRSGTWSTVRAARRMGCQVTIIYPDGAIS